jgi:hypothetical protein
MVYKSCGQQDNQCNKKQTRHTNTIIIGFQDL